MLAQFAQADTFRQMSAHQFRRGGGEKDLAAVRGGHDARCAIQHRAEIIAVPKLALDAGFEAPASGSCKERCAARHAASASVAAAKTAYTPSPVLLTMHPSDDSIACRNSVSWHASASRIASGNC